MRCSLLNVHLDGGKWQGPASLDPYAPVNSTPRCLSSMLQYVHLHGGQTLRLCCCRL